MNDKATAKDAIEFLKFLKEEFEIEGVSAHIRNVTEDYQIGYCNDNYTAETDRFYCNEIAENVLTELKQMEFIRFKYSTDIEVCGEFLGESFDKITDSFKSWSNETNMTLTTIQFAWRAFQKTR